jgi:hypothetical protein
MRSILGLGLLVVVGLLGCKSPEQKLLDANRDAIVAALGRFKALAPIVAKTPSPKDTRWPIADAKVGTNTGILFAEALAGSCNDMRVTYAFDNKGSDYVSVDLDKSEYWYEKLTCAIEGNQNLMLGFSQKEVDTLVGMKYALVLRLTTKQLPGLDKAEVAASLEAYQKTGKGTRIEHFDPGRVAGDALLFELATGELVGYFPFEAASSDTVEATRSYDELRYDLNQRLTSALRAKIEP